MKPRASAVDEVRLADWALLSIVPPGENAVPGGILLVDVNQDALYVQLSHEAFDEDDDGNLDPQLISEREVISEVWRELTPDLEQESKRLGGTALLHRLEEDLSQTFRIGAPETVLLANPQVILNSLFHRHVTEPRRKLAGDGSVSPELLLTQNELASVYRQLPIPFGTALHIVGLLDNEFARRSDIEEIINRDPTLAAHLIKVANSALYGRRQRVRSVPEAINRIGTNRTKLHVLAVAIRGAFSSAPLREIWNHSVDVSKIARGLSVACDYREPDAVALCALVHDIGRVVLWNLGGPFQNLYSQYQLQSLAVVDIERTICGITHAEIGADFLAHSLFPRGLVDAVRHHHTPARSESQMTGLLYLSEALLACNEDIFSEREYRETLQNLGLPQRALDLKDTPDDAHLGTLRFAAAA